jgi:hypothetical protein
LMVQQGGSPKDSYLSETQSGVNGEGYIIDIIIFKYYRIE